MFQTATQSGTLMGDQDWNAVGISASGPGQDAMTFIKVEGENMITFFSGAPTQIRYNYAFSRTVIDPDSPDSVVVSTDTSVSTWIESSTSLDPSFIGQPIEYNGKIYFFFREEAVEARNVAKVVYSRVGQVCANDAGGTQDGAGKFTTFLKARLSCATAGDFQMSFDYLHGIFRSPQNQNIIFGAFTTPEFSFAASAICAYDLAEIEAVFATSAFKGQSTGSSLWLNVPNNDVPENPRPGECSAPQPISSYTKFQLMSKQVPNKADYSSPPRTVLDANSPPLILLQLYRFQKLVVQEMAVSGLEFDIFFLGTSEGQILKAYIYGETPRIVEEILLDLDSDDEAINVLKISKDGTRIFASTTSRVYSIPTENCQRFKTCAECVEGQDPACSWEAAQGRQGCVASHDGLMDLENGSIALCPVASSTTTLQTSPATPATDTTDQTPSLTGTTTGKDGQTPNSKTQTGTSNSSESMGTFPRPPPPDISATSTTPSRLTFRTTPPLPQPTTTEYNPFNYTPVEPNSGQQLVCECEEGPRMELSICYPWILSSVLIVCCCNIPTCIALFLSCKKRKKNYSPSNLNRNRDASQKVPLRSMERLNSEVDEEADELCPMTQTDNGSPHRSINENSLHEKKNGQSSAPLRIPSTATPVRGTTVSASEA
ncbi:semaphorin-1A isoform X1 [Strongylocentrotus purpuratus]|uniref:Sema domain-containing protein n=1 Tax=Strongylocentrotus purpuratus TaxID=7668 RepID=A0A7M7N9A8_STRPU|nr:semaphorin-1A isoform X1 [Strongylocentrotus purpuratus]